MNRAVFKHFDLPVKHLDRDFDYVPPKARQQEEIERRRALPSGALLAENQHRGIRIAKNIIHIASKRSDDPFIPNTLSATEFNTAWYNHASGAKDVMRRRLYLPRFDNEPFAMDQSQILEEAELDLSIAENLAELLRISIEGRHCSVPRFQKKLGIELGNASLRLVSAPNLAEIKSAHSEAAIIQQIARNAALGVVELSRNLYAQTGANPSLAQIADPDSPLMVYWRRHGSNQAVDILEEATQTSNEVSIKNGFPER